MSARLGRVLLVVALLAAQQAALSHQIWHGAQSAPSTGLSSPLEQRGAPFGSGTLCEFHEALGVVLGAASGALAVVACVEPPLVAFVAAGLRAIEVPAPLPASRGPPLYL